MRLSCGIEYQTFMRPMWPAVLTVRKRTWAINGIALWISPETPSTRPYNAIPVVQIPLARFAFASGSLYVHDALQKL
jgi:hypothetical protein